MSQKIAVIAMGKTHGFFYEGKFEYVVRHQGIIFTKVGKMSPLLMQVQA